MKVSRTADGARLRLNPAESHVVEQLFVQMEQVLSPDGLAASGPVRERLYPDGYADAADADAFRELTEATLHAERSARVEACLREVRSSRSIRRTEVMLDADAADRWIRVLNDLRLTFGTQLGITDDADYDLNPNAPDAPLRARYLFLTALQDLMVTELLG